MSLHLTKKKALEAATERELEAARLSLSRKHSSGHKYRKFGVRRAFFVLWETYEKRV